MSASENQCLIQQICLTDFANLAKILIECRMFTRFQFRTDGVGQFEDGITLCGLLVNRQRAATGRSTAKRSAARLQQRFDRLDKTPIRFETTQSVWWTARIIGRKLLPETSDARAFLMAKKMSMLLDRRKIGFNQILIIEILLRFTTIGRRNKTQPLMLAQFTGDKPPAPLVQRTIVTSIHVEAAPTSSRLYC